MICVCAIGAGFNALHAALYAALYARVARVVRFVLKLCTLQAVSVESYAPCVGGREGREAYGVGVVIC